MEFSSYKCDICGKTKGSANHWFRFLNTEAGTFVLAPWDCALILVDDDTEGHACGLGCATKAMLRAMGGEQSEVAR